MHWQRQIGSLFVAFFLVVIGVQFVGFPMGIAHSQDAVADWQYDWATKRYFSIDIDTDGYDFPTAIAFVPNPGTDPKDPLYFVTEIRGTIKVVTNDRSIVTFADNFFELVPKRELPFRPGEVGLAGICLEPQNGYVFATFSYDDSDGVLRNNIVRFQTQPGTFSSSPSSQVFFTDIFSSYRSASSHQIGPCRVDEGLLYVNVGDGEDVPASQEIGNLLGKILRMTLDGQPAPGNPFLQDDNASDSRNYVWASGFRNPWGLKIIDHRVFASDSGLATDRFLEVSAGQDYLYDGTDASIGAIGDVFIRPSLGVAQLEWVPEESTIFPSSFRQSFYLAGSGSMPAALGRGDDLEHLVKVPRILIINYDLAEGRVRSVPELLLRYRGDDIQMVVNLALGPDGLYFVPLFPTGNGKSAIMKISYNPSQQHPFLLEEETDPRVLMNKHGCLGCHVLDNTIGGTTGPPLNRNELASMIETRLISDAYQQDQIEIDRLEQNPFVAFREARQAVASAEGLDKVKLWMKYRIMEPRFDNPGAGMPNLGVSEQEADIIANFLVSKPEVNEQGRVITWVRDLLPRYPSQRLLVYWFFGGIIIGAIGIAMLYTLLRIRRRSGN